MKFKDYYKIMGLEREASQDDIKRAYRKLARKYHPDVSKEADAEARFKELGEAYEVLKDPEKRTAYNRLGSNYKAGEEFHPPPNWDSGFEFHGGGFTDVDMGNFSDFFTELFGQQGHGRQFNYRRSSNLHAEDHHAKVEIDLYDAFHGTTRSISIQAQETDANGQRQLRSRTLKVKIPKGIIDGQQIRLSGQGAPGMNQGKKGDLYLQIKIKPHKIYRAEGKNLHMQLPITPWEAALGATVKAPSPGGILDLKIPVGSNSGDKLRLRGRGLPGSPPGDVYVTLSVMVPPAKSKHDKKLYHDMADSMAFDPRAGMVETL